MHQKLPREIDPFRLAKNGLTLEGTLPLSGMARLAEIILDTQGDVYVSMQFGIDTILGTPFMRGQFSAALTLRCERCFESMVFDAEIECLLAILAHEHKIAGLSEEYDPWVIGSEDVVTISDVVEDELILSLPLIPKHTQACLPDEVWTSGKASEEIEEKVSPFAVLKTLKD